MAKKSLSIVLSLYNEEESIPQLWASLRKNLLQLNAEWIEILWVNDGSSDKTQEKVDEIIGSNPDGLVLKHVALEFTRNFGHEAAMIAGIDHATGDAIICMDGDLQHPPEKIEKLYARFLDGYDVVMTERIDREDNGFLKKKLSKWFYSFLNGMSSFTFNKNASDFFLISQHVKNVLEENFRERNRFLRGYIQIVGFDQATVEFVAPERIAGRSNYSFKKLLLLSLNALFSFSNKPLQLASYISFLFVIFTSGITIFSFIDYFVGENPPSGYTTLIIFISICFTTLFVVLAILSLYLAKGLDEIRQRPIYTIKRVRRKES